MLPTANPVTPGLAPTRRPHSLILNKGADEQIFECEDEEQAFNEAMPWLMKGYIARIADDRGVVKMTQALSDGRILCYEGDIVQKRPGSGAHATSGQAMGPPRKPWWRFW
jgi:hypothetical protein